MARPIRSQIGHHRQALVQKARRSATEWMKSGIAEMWLKERRYAIDYGVC